MAGPPARHALIPLLPRPGHNPLHDGVGRDAEDVLRARLQQHVLGLDGRGAQGGEGEAGDLVADVREGAAGRVRVCGGGVGVWVGVGAVVRFGVDGEEFVEREEVGVWGVGGAGGWCFAGGEGEVGGLELAGCELGGGGEG